MNLIIRPNSAARRCASALASALDPDRLASQPKHPRRSAQRCATNLRRRPSPMIDRTVLRARFPSIGFLAARFRRISTSILQGTAVASPPWNASLHRGRTARLYAHRDWGRMEMDSRWITEPWSLQAALSALRERQDHDTSAYAARSGHRIIAPLHPICLEPGLVRAKVSHLQKGVLSAGGPHTS